MRTCTSAAKVGRRPAGLILARSRTISDENGRLFLPPLIFVKKDAYIHEVVYFIYSKKRQNCAFSLTALLLVVNKVAIKRCFHAIRERPGGLQVVYLPPFPPKSMLSGAATAPSRPSNIDLGGRGGQARRGSDRNVHCTAIDTSFLEVKSD